MSLRGEWYGERNPYYEMKSQQDVSHKVRFEFKNKVSVLLCDIQMDGTGGAVTVDTCGPCVYFHIRFSSLSPPRPQVDHWVELMLRD
jgi:hypothetical protein